MKQLTVSVSDTTFQIIDTLSKVSGKTKGSICSTILDRGSITETEMFLKQVELAKTLLDIEITNIDEDE